MTNSDSCSSQSSTACFLLTKRDESHLYFETASWCRELIFVSAWRRRLKNEQCLSLIADAKPAATSISTQVALYRYFHVALKGCLMIVQRYSLLQPLISIGYARQSRFSSASASFLLFWRHHLEESVDVAIKWGSLTFKITFSRCHSIEALSRYKLNFMIACWFAMKYTKHLSF